VAEFPVVSLADTTPLRVGDVLVLIINPAHGEFDMNDVAELEQVLPGVKVVAVAAAQAVVYRPDQIEQASGG
jgi:hypothetical protein